MAIESVNKFASINAKLETQMRDITDIKNSISARYEQMETYKTNEDQLEISTLIKFAEWTVDPNSYAVNHLLNQMNSKLLGSDDSFHSDQNMLSMLAYYYEVK